MACPGIGNSRSLNPAIEVSHATVFAAYRQLSIWIHEGVVRGVAHGADRGVDAGLDEMGRECKRRVLHLTARIRVMNEAGACGTVVPVALPQGHVEGVEHQLGQLARCDGPADDRPGYTSMTNAT